MLCHGRCGAKLTSEKMFTRTLQSIAKEAGVNVLKLEEHDLRNGGLCHDCALFRKAVGERWQPFELSLKQLLMQQSRVRIVDGKILLPQQVVHQKGVNIR